MAESEAEYNPRKVFVGNLPFSVKSDDLAHMFHPYGAIVGINIREDRVTGKPKGFAFVTFETEDSATSAIASMNNYNYEGRTLTVKRANLRGTEAQKAEAVDNSWKSVPTPSPLERKNADKKSSKGKQASKPANSRPTWDTWVGPAAVKSDKK